MNPRAQMAAMTFFNRAGLPLRPMFSVSGQLRYANRASSDTPSRSNAATFPTWCSYSSSSGPARNPTGSQSIFSPCGNRLRQHRDASWSIAIALLLRSRLLGPLWLLLKGHLFPFRADLAGTFLEVIGSHFRCHRSFVCPGGIGYLVTRRGSPTASPKKRGPANPAPFLERTPPLRRSSDRPRSPAPRRRPAGRQAPCRARRRAGASAP